MTQTTNLARDPVEVEQIGRHKYFLSEQAGYDVGWEVAEGDWEAKHAEQFRQAANSKTKPLAARILGKLRRHWPAK